MVADSTTFAQSKIRQVLSHDMRLRRASHVASTRTRRREKKKKNQKPLTKRFVIPGGNLPGFIITQHDRVTVTVRPAFLPIPTIRKSHDVTNDM